MKYYFKGLKKFAIKLIRTILKYSPFFLNLKYLAKIEILSIIYNEKTDCNDRLHDIDTYREMGEKYRQAIKGIDQSKYGKYISKKINKTSKRRRKLKRSGQGVFFLTRSWHFTNPLYHALEKYNNKIFKYDINEYDKKLFTNNKIYNKAKFHREQAFKEIDVMFDTKAVVSREDRVLTSRFFNETHEICDVFFVDWLNHNTIWALKNIGEEKKIIVRVHSYEVLSFYPLVINFGRIDGLIFISKGIRDLFFELWGWLLPDELLVDVIDNVRCKNRVSPKKINNTVERKKTIGMMQYSLPVKDFRFALEIFKKLYNEDNEFRLLLCGKKLSEVETDENKLLLEEIRSLPCGVVRELGYINDVDQFFRQVGFMISTSQREGSHESLIEGMVYGCIPIVRDWPILAPFEGAKRSFPMCDIITTPEQAKRQIISFIEDYDSYSNELKKISDVFYSENIPRKYYDFIERVRNDER